MKRSDRQPADDFPVKFGTKKTLEGDYKCTFQIDQQGFSLEANGDKKHAEWYGQMLKVAFTRLLSKNTIYSLGEKVIVAKYFLPDDDKSFYKKLLYVISSDHPKYKQGTRFDWGYAGLAGDEGYKIIILPLDEKKTKENEF